MNLKLTKISLGVLFALTNTHVNATEFNLNFLQGGSNVDSSIWENSNDKFPAGRFLVDIELNGKNLGKNVLSISKEDHDDLCLSSAWLANAGVPINTQFYSSYFNETRQCYMVDKEPNSSLDMDFSTQTIKFTLPQKGLAKKETNKQDWDYGMSAIRMNYNANVSVNDVGVDEYGSVGINANFDKWVAASSVGVTEDSLDVQMVTATRAIYDLKADLTVGKTYVANSLVGGAGLLGLGLASNSSMKANDIGYKPIFSGIANSDARVTLTQNGSTIYSEMMPPGPFEISNVNLLNSGDVTMTITERDGTVRTNLFPLTIVPNMLASGDSEFSVYAGLRDNDLSGLFAAGSYGFGFEDYTVKASALVHTDYASSGVSLIRGLGNFGTLSLEGVYTHAKFDNDSTRNGGKFSLTYAKSFESNTNFNFTTTQYTSKDYVEFSGFQPEETYDDSEVAELNKQKASYQVSLSHQLSKTTNASLSAWRRNYWDELEDSTGGNINISNRFDYFSLTLGAIYNESGGQKNYSTSLSISVPFNVFEHDYSSYAGITVSDSGNQSYNAGVSSNIGDNFDYSVSTGWTNTNSDKTYSLQSSYQGERALLNGQLTSSADNISGSASISGSVVVLPEQNDIIFTRDVNDTIAIANIKETSGVKFVSSPYPTNDKGNAVIPLSSYDLNHITLDGSTLPVDIELLTTSQDVVPTEGAVVYMPFDAVRVKRYLFQVTQENGEFVPNGTWAVSSEGAPLGFIAQSGVLFINSVDELKGMKLGKCVISSDEIKDTEDLQQVTCHE
ncbi:PefC/AfrB family outer membrane usher protein [Vibrio vulnificus]|uniref:PefC/AfrB family outer membrane usher protein n=1 Tax=Vibrio vulnificus TaxID=672 RepID=UPI0005F13DA1|nr:PefC/AfrB family outer membrane usher protein [Vibrio vulnificus]